MERSIEALRTTGGGADTLATFANQAADDLVSGDPQRVARAGQTLDRIESNAMRRLQALENADDFAPFSPLRELKDIGFNDEGDITSGAGGGAFGLNVETRTGAVRTAERGASGLARLLKQLQDIRNRP